MSIYITNRNIDIYFFYIYNIKSERMIKMLAYIKGSLEMKNKNYIVIDVGGLGYKIFMSETAIAELG